MGDGVPSWFKSVLRKPQATASVVQQNAVVADTPPVEPTSLARRIQTLLGKLPTPPPSTATDETPSQSQPHDDQLPFPSNPLTDSDVIQALRSPVIMNGSLPDGRPSIWSVLEGMDGPSNTHDPRYPHESSDPDSEMFSDSSSVMVYSPLLPVPGSVVELAESEVVLEEDEQEETNEPEPIPPPPIPGWSWTNNFSSVTSWFTQTTRTPAPVEAAHNEPLTPRTRERRLRAQRNWVPSKDKLSIQCMWWGYRMFLPPPVLDILDDKQLEAARRAAMITTALTWFFNNLPVTALPLPLRPTLLLFQQIAPFLGSIGTFISWSWGIIKAYDHGRGVTLTATWLLPIALIPGTWFERDWPISPSPAIFSPLPPDATTFSPLLTPSPSELSDDTVLSTPVHTPRPPTEAEIPSPQPTLRPLSVPSTPVQTPFLPMSPQSLFRTMHSPPPNSPDSSFSVSSPALSFVTAPSSPPPKSPKRIRMSLASLVAKSPRIHARHSHSSNTIAEFSPSTSTSTPFSGSPFPYYYSVASASEDMMQQPSPPAHPNDLRLLQSPLWQCSPLPPENDVLHD